MLRHLRALAVAVCVGLTFAACGSSGSAVPASEPADTITVPPRAGWSLSVLALTDQCTGVSIHGTKYELDQVTVTNTFPIGISNQWHGEARISVETGILALLESRM